MESPGVIIAAFAAIGTIITIVAGFITSRGNVGMKALELAITNYQGDNTDLRTRLNDTNLRLHEAESRVTDLTAQVNRCEGDKEVLEARLTARIRELERRLDDTGA